MRFIEYSHRHADAIIKADEKLFKRYMEFTDALRGIQSVMLITANFQV